MNSSLVDQNTYTLNEALNLTKERLDSLLSTASDHPQTENLRIEFKITEQNCLSWLGQQKNSTKIFWSNRNSHETTAAIGTAHVLKNMEPALALKHIKKNLETDHSHQRYFGGLCFDNKNIDQTWDSFGTLQFILPRFELTTQADATYFACNIFVEGNRTEILQQTLAELSNVTTEKSVCATESYHWQDRTDTPDKTRWNQKVQAILNDIHNETYKKIVFARKSTFTFEKSLNPVVILNRLVQTASNCYIFSFQFEDGACFLGATPEQLFKREGTHVNSEAIAGTRPRGQTESKDNMLFTQLMTSTKDAHEHDIVVKKIKKELSRCCTSVVSDERPSILRLKGGHHLISRMKGELKENIHDEDLLSALHPTPAVGGSPTDKALAVIKNQEPFKRGWYAGPIGCIGKEETELAVALRCGLLQTNSLDLFAGAGIVADSNPDHEWDEVEHKLNNFLKVFDQ